MARAHYVKRARKDNPAAKKGEGYWWWKFRFGPKRYSKTRPRRSQLTQSAFLSALYEIEDSLHDGLSEDAAEGLVEELEMLLDQCETSLDNMPYHLQDTSESGVLLRERIDALEEWISEIQNIDWETCGPGEAAQMIIDSEPGFP